MKILVTGSDGQLGKTFRYNKASFFNYTFCNKEDLNFLDQDKILNVLSNINPQIIVNCAAYTAVDDAEKNENLASKINFEAVDIISKWCKQNGAFLIHFSTDYIFDGKKNEPYNENDPPNPLSVYGKTKYFGEKAFLKSGCEGVCFRTSWVHSPFGKNFYLTMKNLFLQNQSVKIVNDQFGVPTTTNFLVNISNQILNQRIENKNVPKIIHAVPSNYTNWYDFGIEIFKNLNKSEKNLVINPKKIIPISSQKYKQNAKRPKFSVLSNKMLKKNVDYNFKSWLDEHKLIY
tara:strand:- start:2041 stop:2907 length:867 start_codon:yes stop_codon:yes gene_type:complete